MMDRCKVLMDDEKSGFIRTDHVVWFEPNCARSLSVCKSLMPPELTIKFGAGRSAEAPFAPSASDHAQLQNIVISL